DVRATLPFDDQHGACFGGDLAAMRPRAHIWMQNLSAARRVHGARLFARTIVAGVGGPRRPRDHRRNPIAARAARSIAAPKRIYRVQHAIRVGLRIRFWLRLWLWLGTGGRILRVRRIAEAKIVTEAVIALDAQHLTRSKIAHDERLTRIDAANEAMRAGIRKPGIQAYGAGIDRDFRSVREARFKV